MMRTIDTESIEDYLVWKRDKEMYPPKWTPDEFAEETRMMIMADIADQIGALRAEMADGEISKDEFTKMVVAFFDE